MRRRVRDCSQFAAPLDQRLGAGIFMRNISAIAEAGAFEREPDDFSAAPIPAVTLELLCRPTQTFRLPGGSDSAGANGQHLAQTTAPFGYGARPISYPMGRAFFAGPTGILPLRCQRPTPVPKEREMVSKSIMLGLIGNAA